MLPLVLQPTPRLKRPIPPRRELPRQKQARPIIHPGKRESWRGQPQRGPRLGDRYTLGKQVYPNASHRWQLPALRRAEGGLTRPETLARAENTLMFTLIRIHYSLIRDTLDYDDSYKLETETSINDPLPLLHEPHKFGWQQTVARSNAEIVSTIESKIAGMARCF